MPATKPKFDIKFLDPFPKAYEKWFNDDFHARNFFIRYFTLLNIKIFSKSPIPDKAIIGKKGWLFTTDTEIKVYRCTDNFTESQLKHITDVLNAWNVELEKEVIKLFIAFAPIKASVYNEYMPSNIFKIGKVSYPEQLRESILKNTTIPFIDLCQPLREFKPEGNLFYITDNHWNHLGGFYASKILIDALRKVFPQIPSFNVSDYKITSIKSHSGILAKMFAVPDLYEDLDYTISRENGIKAFEGQKSNYTPTPGFPYPWTYEEVRITNDAHLPKVLIFRDSFGDQVLPVISNYFSKTTMIFDAWQYKINFDIVKNEKPDIVIIMPLECHINHMNQY